MYQKQIDISTILSITLVLMVIYFAIFMGGSFTAFLDLNSFLIVVVGTFLITSACFSVSDIFKIHLKMLELVIWKMEPPMKAAQNSLRMSEFARKASSNILELEQWVNRRPKTDFLRKATELLVDGATPEEIEKILTQDINSTSAWHLKLISILRKSGEIAPAMGLIGTLIGLVQMLSNLSDLEKIGPSMALALLTTFYGAIMSYVVFFPLSTKIERNSREIALSHEIYMKSVISIARKENPRHLQTLINSLLQPEQISYFDD